MLRPGPRWDRAFQQSLKRDQKGEIIEFDIEPKLIEQFGMEASEAKRLKALEDENAKLKRLLAESIMDVSTLREMLGKNF